MSKHTFETDVYFLSQPRVDPIGRGIFGNRVLLYPAATGELVEVFTGVNGLIHFAENGPGWKGTTYKRSPVSGGKDPAAQPAAAPHLPRCIPGSDRTPPGRISGKLKKENKFELEFQCLLHSNKDELLPQHVPQRAQERDRCSRRCLCDEGGETRGTTP